MADRQADILVVDDSELIHKLQQMVATSLGLEVAHAYNGQEALELVRKHTYRAILLDLNMPVLDGLTFLRKLQQEGLPPVPVVVISTEDQDEDIQRALQSGATAYIKKPFTLDQITAVLQRILGLPPTAQAR